MPAFKTLMTDVELYIGSDAPNRTGFINATGYVSTPAASLSPYKFVMALLARALRMGLILRTQTPVLSIEEEKSATGAGPAVSHLIRSSIGEMRARRIVIAANAYTSALLPEYAEAIVPCKGSACHVSGLNGQALPRLPVGSYNVRERPQWSGSTYLIQRTDTTLIVGGAHHTYKQDLPSWYNNVDDGVLLSSASDWFHGFMQRGFIGWENSRAEVSRVWTGIMGYSCDSLPHVGHVPERNGVFILAGFNGHGMPVVFLTAKGVAEMVVLEKSYQETKLPSLYKTSKERLQHRYDDILQGGPVDSSNISNTIRN
jgi:glycine/D-amino acid oxidase-like deaminating enzyme